MKPVPCVSKPAPPLAHCRTWPSETRTSPSNCGVQSLRWRRWAALEVDPPGARCREGPQGLRLRGPPTLQVLLGLLSPPRCSVWKPPVPVRTGRRTNLSGAILENAPVRILGGCSLSAVMLEWTPRRVRRSQVTQPTGDRRRCRKDPSWVNTTWLCLRNPQRTCSSQAGGLDMRKVFRRHRTNAIYGALACRLAHARRPGLGAPQVRSTLRLQQAHRSINGARCNLAVSTWASTAVCKTDPISKRMSVDHPQYIRTIEGKGRRWTRWKVNLQSPKRSGQNGTRGCQPDYVTMLQRQCTWSNSRQALHALQQQMQHVSWSLQRQSKGLHLPEHTHLKTMAGVSLGARAAVPRSLLRVTAARMCPVCLLLPFSQ